MSIRKTPFLAGEYYHIYNRGNDKKAIFLDNHDFSRFMALLYICNTTDSLDMRKYFNEGLAFVEIFSLDRSDTLVDIGVYALMPNHFHILVYEKVDNGISTFMQKLSTAYSMYFNKRYDRLGSLFEGKFKAKHIDSDPYLNWIFSYMHTNPIKLFKSDWKEEGISDFAAVYDFINNYRYSSYYDYFIGERFEKNIINKDAFPEHFLQMNDLVELIKSAREEL